MLALFVYFFSLVYLLIKYTRPNTIARLLVGLYLVSAIVSLLGVLLGYNEVQLNNIAILYYTLCVLISLYPVIKYGNKDCTEFQFNRKFINYFSCILVILSIIKIYHSLTNFNIIAATATNFSDIRSNYYQGNIEFLTPKSKIEVIANLVVYISYITPYFALYYLVNNRKFIAVLLLIASLCVPIDGLCIGEREASLKWLFNIISAIIFYQPVLSYKMKKNLKRGVAILMLPVISFLILMTVSRFGDEVVSSLYVYLGAMPENFSYLFSEVNPMLGGILNFNYIIPNAPVLEGPYNDFISASRFLNVFAGMPGSLWLDFGYYTIFYVVTIVMLISFMMQKCGHKYSFTQWFVLIVVLQVAFMNIFYYDFTLKYYFFWVIVVLSVLLLWTVFDKRRLVFIKIDDM